MILDIHHPELRHSILETTFVGRKHPISTTELPIHQFCGIKYASVPARFRQSRLFATYPAITDASRYGPICPQVQYKIIDEDDFNLSRDAQGLKQDEFQCLNLNITCPGGLTSDSQVPVMLWIHGGGDRGSGSNWIYDGGAFVRKSMLLGKPVIIVTFNFRLGLFGFAANHSIRDDNKIAGDEGFGNYGLRDQHKALEWVHHFIHDFGGDPYNITLFGESSGAADIICHLLSASNQSHPLFQQAIIQSAVIDHNIPDVHVAGCHLSRIMTALKVSTLDQLRSIEADKLIALGGNMRAIDDGVFFRKGWRESMVPQHRDHLASSPIKPFSISSHRGKMASSAALHLPPNLQPLIIGDCSDESLRWPFSASLWTPHGVVRRLKAVSQSLTKATALSRAYDICAHTPEDELVERVLELINDARVSWPTECMFQKAKSERGGRGVWRYVFDQEAPRDISRHASDMVYLFDNVPLPSLPCEDKFFDGPFDDFDEEEALESAIEDGMYDDAEWAMPHVDEFSYGRVRDAIQGRWIAFAHGEAPWNEDKVYVFGPEGETGERSWCIFEGRRRTANWKQALEPLGLELVQKVGVELSRGPPLGGNGMC